MIVLSQKTRKACVSVSLAGDVDEDKKVDADEKTTLSTQKPSGLGCSPPQGPSHSTPLTGSHVLLNSPLHSHIPSVWPSFSSSWALASLPTSPPASSLPPPTHSSHNC